MYIQGLEQQHEPANVSCLPVRASLLVLQLCLPLLRVEKFPSIYTCAKVRVRMCMHACSLSLCVCVCACVCVLVCLCAYARTHTRKHTHALLASSYIRRVPWLRRRQCIFEEEGEKREGVRGGWEAGGGERENNLPPQPQTQEAMPAADPPSQPESSAG